MFVRFGSRSLLSNARACAFALTLVIVFSVGMLVRYLHQQAINDTETTLSGLSTVLTDQADRAPAGHRSRPAERHRRSRSQRCA